MINEILVQNEHGRAEAEFPNPHTLAPLFAVDAPASHCLQYVDPYGDTVLNGVQVRRLIQEVHDLAPNLPPESADSVRELVLFLERAAARQHTYVKFVGD